LMRSIKEDASEIAPSTLFAVASILEGVCWSFDFVEWWTWDFVWHSLFF
jgi:hypothetical protein